METGYQSKIMDNTKQNPRLACQESLSDPESRGGEANLSWKGANGAISASEIGFILQDMDFSRFP
jgi:hypothetical protein